MFDVLCFMTRAVFQKIVSESLMDVSAMPSVRICPYNDQVICPLEACLKHLEVCVNSSLKIEPIPRSFSYQLVTANLSTEPKGRLPMHSKTSLVFSKPSWRSGSPCKTTTLPIPECIPKCLWQNRELIFTILAIRFSQLALPAKQQLENR
jgi:hypothetical protein